MFSLENALRTCARLHSRPNTTDLWPKLLGSGNPFPNQIIEVRGPSKSGINLVMMEILKRVALPPTYDSRTYGRNGSILYFCCKANFDGTIFRSYLLSVLMRYIKNSRYIHQLIGFTMNNLYIFDLENMTPTFMSNQYLDKHNIGLIVIDCMNGYEPEVNLGINTFDCLKKIQYLKPLLNEINTLTIYISNDTTKNPPEHNVFNVINNVFIIENFGGKGIRINSFAYNSKHDIIFEDSAALHN